VRVFFFLFFSREKRDKKKALIQTFSREGGRRF